MHVFQTIFYTNSKNPKKIRPHFLKMDIFKNVQNEKVAPRIFGKIHFTR
jgi:hypothetical protein